MNKFLSVLTLIGLHSTFYKKSINKKMKGGVGMEQVKSNIGKIIFFLINARFIICSLRNTHVFKMMQGNTYELFHLDESDDLFGKEVTFYYLDKDNKCKTKSHTIAARNCKDITYTTDNEQTVSIQNDSVTTTLNLYHSTSENKIYIVNDNSQTGMNIYGILIGGKCGWFKLY